MQWFEGGIAEAVAASKSRNAVFVVFVEGKDDASKSTLSAINSADVSSKLQGSNYVAIKIESETTAHRQFAQIYQFVPVPSLFFIGNSGLPLEVLAGATDEATLLSRLQAVEAVHTGSAPASAVLTPSSANTPGPQTSSQASTSSVSIHTVTSSGTAAGSSSGESASASASSSERASVEERVERAKELLELKRQQKMKEEQEEERRKEIERRKTGRDVQQLKRSQQEQELKQLQEQRRREREENEQARQRVLDQIAQDRANRIAQQSVSSSASPAVSPTVSSSASSTDATERCSPRPSDGNARLQFRLPDGSTHTSSFLSTATLGEVRAYLVASVNLPFRSFLLATTFPRREFQEEENSLTLQDLGLVPTAVMLIIPSGGAGVVQNARPAFEGFSGTLNHFFWSFFSPVFAIFTYLRNGLFGDRAIDNQGERSSSSDATASSSSATQARRDKKTKRGSSSGGVVKRTGSNIHRLHQNHSSSDDDNNTWNGNSTQQM